MKAKLLLRINHFLFWWYYKRVPEFFRKYTILNSISLLKQNYEHLQELYEIEKKTSAAFAEDANNHLKELQNLRLNLIATDKQIDWANKFLGTDLNKKENN